MLDQNVDSYTREKSPFLQNDNFRIMSFLRQRCDSRGLESREDTMIQVRGVYAKANANDFKIRVGGMHLGAMAKMNSRCDFHFVNMASNLAGKRVSIGRKCHGHEGTLLHGAS